MRSPLLAVTPLIAAVAWTTALIVDADGRDQGSVLLIGLGLLLMSVVSVVGMVVAGGRWAWRFGFVVIAGCGAVAVSRETDALWWIAIACTGLAVTALATPSVTFRIRKLPAAQGPPERAVLAPLILISAPFVIGVLAYDNIAWPELDVALSAPLVALAYAKAWRGGLFSMRVFWPLMAVGLAFLMSWPTGTASASLGVIVAALAWHSSVKVAFRPPREVGSTYPIPPELTPSDILDAAGLDDKGRPK